MSEKIYDLEDRLIKFAVSIIKISERFPKSFPASHLSNQLSRSGTAPALNYGEAQSAESRNDFIHKMKLSLKELRETSVCLKIITRLSWFENDILDKEIRECNELIESSSKAFKPLKKTSYSSNLSLSYIKNTSTFYITCSIFDIFTTC